MSLLESALRETLPRVPDRLDELSALIDPAWIEQALAASGKASIRRRKLRAEHAVWLVIGLALFRSRPLWQVVQQLELSLEGQPLPAPSASVQARQRLGEEPLAQLFGLLTQAWTHHSITLFDRAYFSAAFLLDWQDAGQQRHWLMRAKDNLRHEIVEQLGPGDALIRMPVSPQARKLRPQLSSHWQARLIEVSVGGKLRRFITSLQDHKTHPARQLAELYRQRWEIELGFREIKQSLQEGEPVLRSQAARAGAPGAVGRVDRLHAAATLDARDGGARQGRTPAHQLPHRQLCHREFAQHPWPGVGGHLAQTVGGLARTVLSLRAAATPA